MSPGQIQVYNKTDETMTKSDQKDQNNEYAYTLISTCAL